MQCGAKEIYTTDLRGQNFSPPLLQTNIRRFLTGNREYSCIDREFSIDSLHFLPKNPSEVVFNEKFSNRCRNCYLFWIK